MNEKMKNMLWIILAIAIVGFGIYSFTFGAMDHIEDTNGTNTNINRITNEQIVNDELESVGLLVDKKSSNFLGFSSGMVRVHADKFSGVDELFYADFLLNSTLHLDIFNFEINEGNFELVVVHEGKIIERYSAGTDTILIDNLKGYVSIYAVGESANFSFEMTKVDFDLYAHPNY